jgi:hypothetical protein
MVTELVAGSLHLYSPHQLQSSYYNQMWGSIVTWWKMSACEMEPHWASREGEKRCRIMTRIRHSTIAVEA